jgi:hypothetical protein
MDVHYADATWLTAWRRMLCTTRLTKLHCRNTLMTFIMPISADPAQTNLLLPGDIGKTGTYHINFA